MDPRVVPEQFFGPNSQLAVFRNAGGRATPDVVRTILTMRSLAFNTDKATVMVVHHTGEDVPCPCATRAQG
jgi:carbonic anhydrase